MNTNFEAGERVTFTIVRPDGGSGWTFASREGVVVEDRGMTVAVRFRGRIHYPAKAEVRRVGEESALTQAFKALADSMEKKS